MDPTPKPIVANCNVAAAAGGSGAAAVAAAAAAPIGRSNTVFGSLKWWPSSLSSSSSSSSSSNSNNSSSSPNIVAAAAAGGAGGLHVAPQKLRESKWFTPDESRVLCAVAEPGFVVEIREGQENESAYGVLLFKASKDKKPKPQDVDVYTIKPTSAQTAATTGRLLRVVRRSLADLWLRGCTVRIQNFGDREHRAHSEKDIRQQIAFAQKAKQMLWQSSQHFAFWCRYGERQQDIRRKQVDALRHKFPLGIVQ